MCDVLHQELVNTKTQIFRAHTLTSFAFSEVWICFCLSTGAREVLKPETPRYETHSPISPFRRFVHVYVWTSELAKFRTLKISMYWSYLLPLFTFSKVMVRNPRHPDTPSSEIPNGVPLFLFFTFHDFGSCGV
jgi:hypothetical protein